jgi:hypothetical protein
VHHGELLVTTVTSNRRIEADRRQRRFATLAPSAHAGRYTALAMDDLMRGAL